MATTVANASAQRQRQLGETQAVQVAPIAAVPKVATSANSRQGKPMKRPNGSAGQNAAALGVIRKRRAMAADHQSALASSRRRRLRTERPASAKSAATAMGMPIEKGMRTALGSRHRPSSV